MAACWTASYYSNLTCVDLNGIPLCPPLFCVPLFFVKERRLALVPSPKRLVAHLDQFVVGLEVAKRRLAPGVSNRFKWVVGTWVADKLCCSI